MNNFFLIKWLRNVTISKKLYFTVGIMSSLIIIELATLSFAIKTLSSVRALVGAEGLWSKAQKDAAYTLRKYGRSHNEADYREYQNFLKVPLGDHKTRLELLKPNPDLDIARQGFIEGRIHPDDINGAVHLFRRFHNIYYINKAIRTWTAGDSLLSQMLALGNQLHAEITSASPSPERIVIILNQVDNVNDKLTNIEDNFSYTLGEGSRWLEYLILKLLLGLVLTVEICGLSLTIFVSRGISRGLNEIIASSEKIAGGDLGIRAKIFSKDEIGTLANSFNEMTVKLQKNINALKQSEDNLRASKKVAEQSVVVKENFLANMSHEIRTPMNAVIGFTDILEHSNLDEEQRQVVEYLKISGKNLLALINDILDYSKIESGMIVIEHIPFKIGKTFESLHILLQQKAADKSDKLELTVDRNIPETLIGDPTRLMQILLNLADNAIKFTDNGAVTIASVLQSETDEQATVRFDITDTGEGIPEDKFSVIFERFTQVSAATTRKHGGTGLGLSIVKSLVALQEGTLSLKSEPGKGSVFSFTINYKKIRPAVSQPVTEKIASAGGKNPALRILLVEDNNLNQVLVLKSMKPYGYQIDVADNGKIAIEKMRQNHYDLILMDIQMPEMDGHEATRIIRKELKNDIPIIALTAHAMNDEKEKCFRSGMNEFVSKPFDAKDLHEKIRALTAKHA